MELLQIDIVLQKLRVITAWQDQKICPSTYKKLQPQAQIVVTVIRRHNRLVPGRTVKTYDYNNISIYV